MKYVATLSALVIACLLVVPALSADCNGNGTVV